MKGTLVTIAVMITACQALAQTPRAGESIVVERLIVDAHITEANGEPIPDITAADLEVEIDGELARIDGVDWYPEWGSRVDPDTGATVTVIEDSSYRGRLLVFFFQTDFERSRIVGLVRMVDQAKKFLDTLAPQDLVAVVQFDSQMKLLADFTSDRDELTAAIEQSLRIEDYFWTDDGRWPSIARYLSVEKGRKTASPERALRHLGEALQHTEGIKSIIMFGWGLGRYGGYGTMTYPEFAQTRLSLETARASVFSLDVSDADWHTLELGMRKMSEETGGFYEKTHIFAALAMEKLGRTLSGRYEIVLFKPKDLKQGTHDIDVKVKRRGAIVLTRGSWLSQ